MNQPGLSFMIQLNKSVIGLSGPQPVKPSNPSGNFCMRFRILSFALARVFRS